MPDTGYFDQSANVGLVSTGGIRTLTANIDSSGDSILSNILLATSGESFYFDSNSSMSLGLNAPVPVRTLTTVMPTEFKRTAISGSELQRFTD